jgi:hypothetical protein
MQDAGRTYFVYAVSAEAAGSTFQSAMGRAPESQPIPDTEAWSARQVIDERRAPGS